MFIVWYNPNIDKFYVKYTDSYLGDKRVGYCNSYGHEIVQILCEYNNILYSVNCFYDMVSLGKHRKKNSFLKRLIRFLEKISG